MMTQNELDDLDASFQDLMDLPVAHKYRARMRDALGAIEAILRKNGLRVEAERIRRGTP